MWKSGCAETKKHQLLQWRGNLAVGADLASKDFSSSYKCYCLVLSQWTYGSGLSFSLSLSLAFLPRVCSKRVARQLRTGRRNRIFFCLESCFWQSCISYPFLVGDVGNLSRTTRNIFQAEKSCLKSLRALASFANLRRVHARQKLFFSLSYV